MCRPSSLSVSRSSSLPFPSQIPDTRPRAWLRPSLQGVQVPQDSLVVNSKKYRAESTMQLSLSMTTIPPDPMMAPSAPRLS